MFRHATTDAGGVACGVCMCEGFVICFRVFFSTLHVRVSAATVTFCLSGLMVWIIVCSILWTEVVVDLKHRCSDR